MMMEVSQALKHAHAWAGTGSCCLNSFCQKIKKCINWYFGPILQADVQISMYFSGLGYIILMMGFFIILRGVVFESTACFNKRVRPRGM